MSYINSAILDSCIQSQLQYQPSLFNQHMTTNNNEQVAKYLKDIISKQPNTQQIKLQFKSITDLLPFLHLFKDLPKLKKLSLHGNRIKQLPSDLSIMQNLQQLDISNNLLNENIQMTIISLKTLPRLKKLTYPVRKDKEQRIAEEVKTLQFLNNANVFRKKAQKQYQFKNATERALYDFQQNIMVHFKTLLQYQTKYLGQMIEVDADKRFRQQLSQISRECLQKLNMSRERATESLQNIMLYMTKFDMYEMLKIRCLNICMDIYSDVGKFLKTVMDDQDKLFKHVSEMTLSLARIQLDQKQKQDQQRYNNQFQSQHSIVNKNAIMQKELKRMRKQKDQLIAEISQLETHNKKLADLLMKYSKGDGAGTKGLPLVQTFQSNAAPSQMDMGKSRERDQTLLLAESTRNDNRIRNNIGQMSKIARDTTLGSNNYTSNKTLSIKQLKQTIQQIYQSKLRFDQKNYQGKLATETMNQYLFTYLNQKYGLKSLTIEAASNIVSGIQQYSAKDNDIAVFGKILRNEVDQQFRFVQTQLKTTIIDLLKMHIKSKMPYKSAAEINDIMSKKTNGEIGYEQCEDIVKYLYKKSDATQIMMKLESAFIERQKKDLNPVRRRNGKEQSITTGRGKVQFSVFLQTVLNFQLKNHQKLLRPLVNAFKLKDRDNDGIVDEQEFVSIIQLLCDDAGDLISSLLDVVDPYQTKAITFTKMVRLVANYPEDNPILNRYAQKNNTEEYLEEQH